MDNKSINSWHFESETSQNMACMGYETDATGSQSKHFSEGCEPVEYSITTHMEAPEIRDRGLMEYG